MNGLGPVGKVIIVVGMILIIAGGIMILLSKIPGSRGHPLPGDIAIRWGNVRIYFPIVTSLVISIVLTLLLMLLARLGRR